MAPRTQQVQEVQVDDDDRVGDVPTYGEIREDITRLLGNLGAFVSEGRRPHHLSEDGHARLQAAFDGLLDKILDADDELRRNVDVEDKLAEVMLLRAFC